MSASSHFCSSSPLSTGRVLRPARSVPAPPVVPVRPLAPGPESTDIAAARRGPPASPPKNIRYHNTPSPMTRTDSASDLFGSLRNGPGSLDVHPAAALPALLSVVVVVVDISPARVRRP